jgi:acetate kinase
MYTYRIKKYIGAYAAAMGGVDIIVFTGGAGENQWQVREGATEGLEYMGIKVDEAKNHACRATESIISADDSKVTVCVIPTDEELMIATDTMNLLA